MANAKKDENGRSSITCASSTNGTDIVAVYANPTTNNSLKVDDNTTGSNNGNNQGVAMIDENGVAVWYALSSVDGTSLVELYADPITHKLLINSN